MITDLLAWLQNSYEFFQTSQGMFLFVPCYAIWVIVLMPGIWASMLAGALYGTVLGTCLVLIGAVIGAQASFVISRTLLRQWVSSQIARFPKIQLMQKAVSREGLKLIFLTRLSPAFPFSLLNFAYGISNVSWRDFSIGLIAIVPGSIVFCALGHLAGDLSQFTSVLSGQTDFRLYLLRLIGIFSTIGVVFLVGRSLKLALQSEGNHN